MTTNINIRKNKFKCTKIQRILWKNRSPIKKYPSNFFAPKKEYLTENILINYGCDFGLILSNIENGNLIQHDYFASGAPVITYKIGGIQDTVINITLWTRKATVFYMIT